MVDILLSTQQLLDKVDQQANEIAELKKICSELQSQITTNKSQMYTAYNNVRNSIKIVNDDIVIIHTNCKNINQKMCNNNIMIFNQVKKLYDNHIIMVDGMDNNNKIVYDNLLYLKNTVREMKAIVLPKETGTETEEQKQNAGSKRKFDVVEEN